MWICLREQGLCVEYLAPFEEMHEDDFYYSSTFRWSSDSISNAFLIFLLFLKFALQRHKILFPIGQSNTPISEPVFDPNISVRLKVFAQTMLPSDFLILVRVEDVLFYSCGNSQLDVGQIVCVFTQRYPAIRISLCIHLLTRRVSCR